MSELKGKYTVAFDPKGRLAIPVKHRSAFPQDQQDSIIVTRGIDTCITGYYREMWDDFTGRIESMDRNAKEKRIMRREFVGRSADALFDKQGRITLPADLIEFAKLENCSEVFVMGCGIYIEIWNPDLYKSRDEQDEEVVQRVMDEINI